MRGLGLVEAFAAGPDWLVPVAAAVTQLGDAWFLYLGLTLLYWFGNRRLAVNPRHVGTTLLAIALAALAVTTALKSLLAVPRPLGAGSATVPTWLPDLLGAAYLNAATGTGFGFPSGHAIAATMVYGGLATFLDVWSRRVRWLAAGVVVAAVSLSRIVLGVHYLVDVLAGIVVGLVALAVLHRIARSGFRPRPDRVFFTSAILGVLALVVAFLAGHDGEVLEAAIAAGGAFGGYLVWRLRGAETAAVGPAGALFGAAIVGALFLGAYGITLVGLPVVFGVVPDTTRYRLLAVLPLSFLAVALVVAWPTVVGRLGRPSVAGVPEEN
ncbi:phosphatase PAP2 family protein [Halorarum salinum]|uniref:Phosphatase PAP2 family protein n=1 Tax=Halorarum salinum TaxID=2743089 RepID=A0A7D5Q832_9EURY|nr:phosphatase PAP2 family protein [Halobaculum salinum]QLG60657.1 phosphatase PAP2 family protein [Halobaculum salinum]